VKEDAHVDYMALILGLLIPKPVKTHQSLLLILKDYSQLPMKKTKNKKKELT
jgi:hypothetical protein